MTEAPLLVPHGTFLTREKTEAEQQFMPCGMLGGKKAKKDTLVRRAYLQLDLLKPGDVFVSGATRPFFLSGFCGGGGGVMVDGVRARMYRVICLVDFCHCCLVARCLFCCC